ncbi:hybrid sensor histidine kinase/response regulator [Alteromonas sp. ASW11-19]|uniref:histidine kinase n=1 Tax=Alteromonas salexigens TaxID=2982530 RepID=A0ABT2VLR1_9ALTE|nr:PAS domain-containing hybrid sensor histidine kinase/response regulator [Alteromonas salexigens]MCU7553793.1 hybrid sensor histidine kinase/response regulator [Alteromonas salexigens]
MLSIWTVGCIVALYLGLLFLLAFWGDKHLRDNQQHPVLYSLGLGVHCTSWAFFGTTAQAAQYGWAVVPTYAGIILTMAFAFPVVLRIARLCQRHNVSSLADLIGLRYQHSHTLAGLITILSFIGVIPYIALQLDAITESINLLTPTTQDSSRTVGFYVAALMALFAILFGTRTLSLTDKHPGLLLTIAAESLIKLAGLLVVGIFVCYVLFDGVLDVVAKAAADPRASQVLYADAGLWVYISHVMLGVCSMFVLPRQFHMNFIELNGEGELRTARWLFPLYLLGMTVFVLPIALAGSLLLPASMEADAYVLALPLQADNLAVSVTAFIGGLSATTSMVIVATLALGIMISNNLITPLWLKLALKQDPHNTMQARSLLTIRRVTVLVVLSVAFWYHLNVSQSAPLVKSGIIAIALLAQAFPILMFGVYWRRATRQAAKCALLAGFVCWVMWLLYPSVMSSYYFNPAPTDGELGLGFAYSLLVNCVVFVVVALLTSRRALPVMPEDNSQTGRPDLAIRISDLTALTEKVLEPEVNRALIQQLSVDINKQRGGYASSSLLQRAEKLIAGQVGNPSARILLSAIADTTQDTLPELVEWVEEASLSFQFNHEVLQSSVQNIEQGISVLDDKLCMLAWNERYVELFHYPRGFLKAGMAIEELLLYNAQRGLLGEVHDFEREIAKRIEYMKAGSRYKYVRKQPDGRVIELNGSPLPGGGYVTTYSDITEYIAIQDELKSAKAELEDRVRRRTEELHQAKLEADHANESKTKFLAAAGHDLMQPFNAATLFAAMLAQKHSGTEQASLTEGLVNSLNSAESLLSMLLDMTKLESGVLTAQVSQFCLDDVLSSLVREFSVIAAEQGLTLRYCKTRLIVKSDKKLLRRIAQNLLSNAIRYTQHGGVLIGARRQGSGKVVLCVYDTGPGIAEHQQHEIFNEFHQLDKDNHNQGLGLGLTIVERISHLLKHNVDLHSQMGKGTVFRVTLPRCAVAMEQSRKAAPAVEPSGQLLAGKTVLLLENDAQITVAMTSLLSDWGASVVSAATYAQALARCDTTPDIVLVDYHLDHGETGIEAAQCLRKQWKTPVPGILITANRSDGIRDEAMEADLLYLPKPVKPAALKRLIKRDVHFGNLGAESPEI